ncbi:MAG: tetratricopeptide repeat protein [candidate division NC10 bacterium]|nr:tetratricopeptide repeat protein [candidate division NC10 bacterium]
MPIIRRFIPELLICLTLSLIVFLVFGSSLKWDFVRWDDDINIYRNPLIRNLDWAHVRWMFTDYRYLPRYTPLGWLGWAVIYRLFGLNPFGYHLSTVILHVSNTVLVFWLIRQLLTIAAGPESPLDSRVVATSAGLAALLWGVHPLRVESVAWASGQTHSQALFFLLISLLSYLSAIRTRQGPATRTIPYWVSVASFVASLLSYPSALGFIAVLVVLDFYPLHRFSNSTNWWWDDQAREIWREKIPFLMATVAVLSITIWARVHATGLYRPPVSINAFPLSSRSMQAFYLWAYYVWRPFRPFNLSPVYTALVKFDPTEARFFFSMVFVVGVTLLAVMLRRRYPAFLAVWVCHLTLLVPLLAVTERPYYPNDRYSYFVGTCWAALIGGGFSLLGKKSMKRPIIVGVSMLTGVGLVLFSWLSYRQTLIWKDSATLFGYVIGKLGDDPYRSDIYSRLASFYLERGETDKALACLNASLNADPQYFRSRLLRGEILFNKSMPNEAAHDFREALRLKESPLLHYYMGLTLTRLGQNEEAIGHLFRALQLDPKDESSSRLLAELVRRQGSDQRSINSSKKKSVPAFDEIPGRLQP